MLRKKLYRLLNLISVTKYGVIFLAVQILLPLSAYKGVPLHSITGNLFHENTPWSIFWLSMAFCTVAWSIMFTQGMMVTGVDTRLWIERRSKLERGRRIADYLPPAAIGILDVPVTRLQFLIYTALALPGFVTIVRFGTSFWALSVIACLFGILCVFFVAIVLTWPAQLLYPSYNPLSALPTPLQDRLRAPQAGTLHTILYTLSTWLKKIYRLVKCALRINYLLPEQHDEDHFLAFTNATLLFVILIGVGLGFSSTVSPFPELPAAVYIYVLLTFLIWIFSGLDFHLSRLHVPTFLAVIGLIFVFDQLPVVERDHYFTLLPPHSSAARLTPIEVATANPNLDNLVIVTSMGGGIAAAGWTTLALEKLIGTLPQLKDEIRLLSTVSGGSVGAAFYVDGKLRDTDLKKGAFESIKQKSMASSLDAAAYGLAYPDFWGLVLNNQLPFVTNDRGTLLEESWARIAGGQVDTATNTVRKSPPQAARRHRLQDLKQAIRAGHIPAFIFGTTVMESGRRVMITPVDFNGSCEYDSPQAGEPRNGLTTDQTKTRACTLNEYLQVAQTTDLDIWTGARLSATFPWVSPAARAKPEEWLQEISPCSTDACKRQKHHLLDGGYYDNYGVASALDWLTPVLNTRIANSDPKLIFKRVAIVQLRTFPLKKVSQTEPKSGVVSALIGPVLGLFQIRTGVAIERNRIDTTGLINRYKNANAGLRLETFIFQPSSQSNASLSWHLTKKEKEALEKSWDENAENQKTLEALKTYLTGERKKP